MKWIAAVALAGVLLPACTSPARLEPITLQAGTVSDTVKVLATDPVKGNRSIWLHGARNEYVAFQIVVYAPRSSLTGVSPHVTTLRGSKGQTIPASDYHLYRETYQNITTPSDSAAQAGLWPDGLVPIGRDPIVGEVRNGAPFSVDPGHTQAIWVDLYVPRGQSSGDYSGTITITAQGGASRAIPVRLTVWAFTLPVQPSLPTAFGFDAWDAYRGFYKPFRNQAKMVRMTNLFSEAALQMRISLFGINVDQPAYTFAPSSDRISPLKWGIFDATAAPAYNGTLDSLHRRFTAGALPVPRNISSPERSYAAEDIAFWKAVAAHFRRRGWFSRAYVYYDDEPRTPTDFATARLHASILHAADRRFRYLLTTTYRPDLVGSVNIWTPVINELDAFGYPGMAVYHQRQAAGDSVWWYDSDMSADHGQWPDMFIDHPAMNQRVLAWMTWRYGLQGFLYYDTVYAFPFRNPWNGQYAFGTNGDGTLFYPGKASIIGGKTDIPCFSIRLMLIRQSMQDYEYMEALSDHGRRAQVDALVRTVVPATDNFAHDPSLLLQVRLKMGEELSQLAAPIASAHRPRRQRMGS